MRWWLAQAAWYKPPPHYAGPRNVFRTTWLECVIDFEMRTGVSLTASASRSAPWGQKAEVLLKAVRSVISIDHSPAYFRRLLPLNPRTGTLIRFGICALPGLEVRLAATLEPAIQKAI